MHQYEIRVKCNFYNGGIKKGCPLGDSLLTKNQVGLFNDHLVGKRFAADFYGIEIDPCRERITIDGKFL